MNPRSDRPAIRPLSGVRVLEFSHFLAGPYAGLALADLGADVVKVEDPAHPDEARSMGPYFREGESLYFLSLNWGKRSLALRLKSEQGRAAVLRLAESADVVLENYRPGVMAKLGLGPETMRERNPGLVYCSLTGFGATGPYAAHPGYDYTIQGLTGVMSLAGAPDGPPTKAGMSYVDHAGALGAALAVTAALAGRATTGEGTHIDLGLVDVQLSMLTYLASWQLNAPYVPQRMADSAHPSLVPAQNFPASDGYLSLFVGNDWMWTRLVEEIGDADLAHPDYATREGRARHREALVARLSAIFRTDTAARWAVRLATAGVACAPVNDLAGALDDPHVAARGLLSEAKHPAYGSYRHTRGPVPALSVPDPEPAPLLGEHSADVLSETGYSPAEIKALVQQGIVHVADPGSCP